MPRSKYTRRGMAERMAEDKAFLAEVAHILQVNDFEYSEKAEEMRAQVDDLLSALPRKVGYKLEMQWRYGGPNAWAVKLYADRSGAWEWTVLGGTVPSPIGAGYNDFSFEVAHYTKPLSLKDLQVSAAYIKSLYGT